MAAFENEGEQIVGDTANDSALKIAAIVLLASQQDGDFLGGGECRIGRLGRRRAADVEAPKGPFREESHPLRGPRRIRESPAPWARRERGTPRSLQMHNWAFQVQSRTRM
jgi:hypothetical protein